MKILLAFFWLVVLVGCQDLGDYPDYKATTTPPPANGTGGGTGGNSEKRPHDVIPLGGPTMIGERDLYCENATQPFFMIEVSSDTTRAWAINFVPKSLYIMNEIRTVGGKKYVLVDGTAAAIGDFIVPIGITNSVVSSTVYVTMHISAKRQSVAQ